MKKALTLLTSSLISLFLLVGCTSSNTVVTLTLPLTPTKVKIQPTPAAPGDPATWQDLQVKLDSAEITSSFITEFGTRRVPSAGQKFLWVRVHLENVGENEIVLPAAEHFSALYADSELKPTYGHRQDYVDYTALSSPLFPGQSVDAWLRFDIPETAEFKDLLFVFMPESVQVGVLPSSSDYPWGGEHPVFGWTLE
jgi:hypothetical protein